MLGDRHTRNGIFLLIHWNSHRYHYGIATVYRVGSSDSTKFQRDMVLVYSVLTLV